MEEKQIKKILNIFKEFTDKNCPKEELKYVYYNSERKELVATDTIRLLVAEVDLDLDDNYLIDVNKKGNFINGEMRLLGSYNAYKEPRRMYPKYENVIPNKIEKNEYSNPFEELKIKDVIINVGSITNKQILVNFFKAYDKLNDVDENLRIYLDKDIPEKCPVLIEWKSNLTNTIWKLVFMPITQ